MHTIRQFRAGEGGWVTIFVYPGGAHVDIQRFTNRADAITLASFLNGGTERAMTEKGLAEFEGEAK